MSESRAKRLFFEDKSFGLAVLQLIIGRLTEDNAFNQASPSQLAERQQPPCESSKDCTGTQHMDDRRFRERARVAEVDFKSEGTTSATVFNTAQKLSDLFSRVIGRLYEDRLAKAEREVNRHRSFMRIPGGGHSNV